MNTDGMRAIDDLIRWHRETYRTVKASRPLFPSRNGQGKQRMTRRAAHNVLKSAFMTAGLNGHLATHSLRKSFAQRLYEQTGDVFTVQEMLGHKSIATTQKYLGVNYASPSAKRCRKCLSMANFTKRAFWEVHSNPPQTKPCFSNWL